MVADVSASLQRGINRFSLPSRRAVLDHLVLLDVRVSKRFAMLVEPALCSCYVHGSNFLAFEDVFELSKRVPVLIIYVLSSDLRAEEKQIRGRTRGFKTQPVWICLNGFIHRIDGGRWRGK